MFPIIDKRETGINIRKIMDCQGLTAKDVQQYLDHLWQCIGSTASTIWSAGTMISTGCRCQISRLMYADTPIAQIWQNRE